MNYKILYRCTGVALLLVSTGLWAADPAPVVETALQNSSTQQRTMLELLNRLDQLERELRQLRGDLEVSNHDIASIKNQQRELYLDMDRRLRELELSGVRGSSTQASPESAVPTAPSAGKTPTAEQVPESRAAPTATAAAASEQEKIDYRSAFNLLKEGRYDRSISAFVAFMKKYPQSSYADNAQYWLGEANYVSRKYKDAVTEFNKVLSDYPASPKVPDAMLKLGFTHYELKEWDKARELLQGVVKNYPDSSAAKLADTRLKRMQSEGH